MFLPLRKKKWILTEKQGEMSELGTEIFNRKSTVAPKNMVSLAKLLKTCQRIS
jgi:hypothetical protein